LNVYFLSIFFECVQTRANLADQLLA
jgi:hypothetical protein